MASFGLLTLSLAAISPVHAADGSWNVNTAGSWTTAGSWLSSVIPGATSDDANTDTATFGFTLTAGRTVTVDANRSIKFIDFSNTSASGYTLATGNLLLNNGGSITSSGTTGAHTDTISAALQLRGDGGSYTFGANSSLSTRLLTISGGITGVSTGSNVTTLTLNGANTGLNTVSGIIGDGSGGGKVAVVKDGAGTWRLNGANTATGNYTVNAGTLTVSSATTFANAGTFTLASGARLDVAATTVNLSKLSTANGGSGVVAGSFLRYSADQTTAGSTSAPGTILGTVELNAGNVRPNYIIDFGSGSKVTTLVNTNFTATTVNSFTLSGDTTFEAANTLTVTGNISSSTLGLKTLTLTGASTGTYNSGFLSGSGSIAVVKEGAGSWNIGNSSNDSVILGGVVINEGSLAIGRSTTTFGQITSATNIPSVALGDTSLNNTKSATLALNSLNNGIRFDVPITVRAGSSGVLKITRNGTKLDFASARGGITLNNDVTIDGGSTAGQGLTVSTVGISGTGNVTTDNAVIFSVANTYVGTTTVNSGTLSAGVANALPDTALAVNTGATFDMSLTNATFDQRVTGLNDGIGGGGIVVGNSINTANSANIQDRTLTLDGTSGSFSYSGVIMDKPVANTTATSTLSLAKTGASTQTLSGTNTYTGATTVSGGNLIVSGSIASSATTVGSGATLSLSGSGTVGSVTVNSGTFQLGTAGTAGAVTINDGTLGGVGTVNSLTFTGASTFGPGNSPGTVAIADGGTFTLSGSTTSTFQFTDSGFGAGTFDLVTTSGTATGTIDGILNLDFTGSGYTAGTSVTFINLSSITGTFSTVNVTGLSALGLTANVNYNNAAGDVYLTLATAAIPEPSAYALLGGFGTLLLALGYRLRARRASTT
jgi:autotransporter-associated beta strand protein